MSSSRNDPVFASVMTASLYERADDVRCSQLRDLRLVLAMPGDRQRPARCL